MFAGGFLAVARYIGYGAVVYPRSKVALVKQLNRAPINP